MKRVIFLPILLIFLTVSFRSASADAPFDSYQTNIFWKEEVFRLDNFAIYIHKNPNFVGYMIYKVGKRDSMKRVRMRANRARKYLVNHRKVEKSRIIILINAGDLDESITGIFRTG